MGAVGAFQCRVSPPRRRRLPVGSSAAVGGCAAGSAPRRGRRLLAERLSECAAPGPPRSARPGPAPAPGRVPPRPADSRHRPLAGEAPPAAAGGGSRGGHVGKVTPGEGGPARRERSGMDMGMGMGRRTSPENPEPPVAGQRCQRGSAASERKVWSERSCSPNSRK